MNPSGTKLNILDGTSASSSAHAASTAHERDAGVELDIEVVSDVVCPWCWVGKRRLEKAVALLGLIAKVKITWRPFQLNPAMPREGADRRQYIASKFGSAERFAKIEEHLAETGAGEGIDFQFARIARSPNTVDAHRLIWLSQQHGRQDAMVEALFKAYFRSGVDVGDRKHLADIAAEAGIEKTLAENFLASDAGLPEVAAEEAHFKNMGIHGVPAFVVNGQYLFSGAVEPVAMVEAFREAGGTDRNS